MQKIINIVFVAGLAAMFFLGAIVAPIAAAQEPIITPGLLPNPSQVGKTMTATLVVNNPEGRGVLPEVVVLATAPEETDITSANLGGVISVNSIFWDLGDILPGTQKIMVMTFVPANAGVITITYELGVGGTGSFSTVVTATVVSGEVKLYLPVIFKN